MGAWGGIVAKCCRCRYIIVELQYQSNLGAGQPFEKPSNRLRSES